MDKVAPKVASLVCPRADVHASLCHGVLSCCEPASHRESFGRPFMAALPSFSRECDPASRVKEVSPHLWWSVLLEYNTDPTTKELKPFQCTICRQHKWAAKRASMPQKLAPTSSPPRAPPRPRRLQLSVLAQRVYRRCAPLWRDRGRLRCSITKSQ